MLIAAYSRVEQAAYLESAISFPVIRDVCDQLMHDGQVLLIGYTKLETYGHACMLVTMVTEFRWFLSNTRMCSLIHLRFRTGAYTISRACSVAMPLYSKYSSARQAIFGRYRHSEVSFILQMFRSTLEMSVRFTKFEFAVNNDTILILRCG